MLWDSKMDTKKLTEVLRATIDPNQRQQAEEQLSQIHKIIGFAPALLQVVMSNEVDKPVRQAGVIYLKNLVIQNWQTREGESGEPLPFSVHEQDRAMVRDAIVDAVVQAPDIIKVQLAVCVHNIITHDFPSRWTQIVDKVSIYLQNPDSNCWSGALLCLYQLVKNYEYSNVKVRAPLIEAMNLLLPIVYDLMTRLLPDQSEQSVLLQKQILKIYFSLIQYSLPLELINKERFSQWMEILRAVADKPVPPSPTVLEEEELVDLPWWKCKKWAVHTLYRIFERYGSPGNVLKEYAEFAEWYLTTFSAGILEVLLKILNQYRNQVYVSPRVLQQSLNYINQSVAHAHTWKFLKPHMFTIIQDVIFPLMSHSASDEELWNTDPYEYIRVKFDIFEDYVSPVTAAQTLLLSCCKKRKDMLQRVMQLCMQVLTTPEQAQPRQKDGVLHMVGTLSEVLLKKKMYKDQVDTFLKQYVYTEFSNCLGYIRARACWVLHHFAEVKFKSEQDLAQVVGLTINSLLNDSEIPVKVEAAIALQMLLGAQSKAQKYIEPQIENITMALLNIIRETENDDLTQVLQKIVYTYTEKITPIAVDICQHLASTFYQIIKSDSGSDEKAITAMGILNAIETLLNVMEGSPDIMVRLEGTVLQVVGHIFQESALEFYEEALSLVCDLTCKSISNDMWLVLEMIYQMFTKDGFDYFVDMMPALHNYITVDTPAFLSNPNRLLMIFNICKAVLAGDGGEDPECNAMKLLEVVILQCKGQIDECIPSLVELVLGRLTREIKTSELRAMCLQVLIAAIYYNPQLLFSVMDKLERAVPTVYITAHFIQRWIYDTDCFFGLHDRKLCVLGLCTLLDMGNVRPSIPDETISRIIPSCIVLFDGLKKAYIARAENEDDDSDSDDDSDCTGTDVLSSDEDEVDERSAEYLENLAKSVKNKLAAKGNTEVTMTTGNEENGDDDEDYDDDDDDDDDDDQDATTLESYTTPLDGTDCTVDEYVIFKDVMSRLAASEPQLYSSLMGGLNAEEQKAFKEIFEEADLRKAQQDSKRIEQSGGYAFTVPTTVPTFFKFGS